MEKTRTERDHFHGDFLFPEDEKNEQPQDSESKILIIWKWKGDKNV